MNCSNCGLPIRGHEKFCPACGNKIEIPERCEKNENEEARIRSRVEEKIEELETACVSLKEKENYVKRTPGEMKNLKEEEKRLRTEVSQLRLVEKQRESKSFCYSEPGERYLLTLQPKIQEETKQEKSETVPRSLLYMGTASTIVAMVAYFMDWIAIPLLGGLKLYEVAQLAEQPMAIAAYAVPILFGIYLFRLWTENDPKDAQAIGHWAVGVNVVVFMVTAMKVAGAEGDLSFGIGVWTALIASIADEVIMANLSSSGSTEIPHFNLEADKFNSPVVNYNALFPMRPIRVCVNAENQLFVDFVHYQEKMELLQLDIDLVDRLHDIYTIKNVKLSKFQRFGNSVRRGEAKDFVYHGPTDIAYAKIYIRQYCLDDGMAIRTVPLYVESQVPLERLKALREYDSGAFHEMQVGEEQWHCVCGTENYKEEQTCIFCGKVKRQ